MLRQFGNITIFLIFSIIIILKRKIFWRVEVVMYSHSLNKPNISQIVVLAKLKTYLTQQQRDPDFIAKIMSGYCSGLCTVAAYSQWLALQPSTSDEQGKPKPRDDWPWMKSVLTMLSQWDQYSLFTKEQQIDIERLVSLIEYFQNIAQYTKTPQGELQESLKDTRERRLTKTYTLAGVFTIKDLRALLLTPQDNTLLLIESHDHMISILEQNNQYYYYNANDTHGRQIYDKNQLNDLLIKIAGAMDATTIDTPLLLALRFFSFTPQTFNTQILPSPEAFLASLPDYHQRITGVHNQADQYTAIYIAAEIGCLASLTFHLNQHPEMINDKSPDGYTPAFIAADLGNIEALCILAKYGANLNVALLNGATPAFIAAQQGQSS